MFRFFRTTDRGEAMAIARELDARFVALYGADRLRFDPAGALEPVYEDGVVRILRIKAMIAGHDSVPPRGTANPMCSVTGSPE